MTPRRLKIAQIVTRMDVGGVPDHVMTLARELSAHHDLTLVAAEFHPMHAAELSALGVEQIVLPFARLPDPMTDLRALRGLRQLLRARRFDIAHTHMSKAALLGVLAARTLWARPLLVNTAHNLGSLALANPVARAVFRVYDWLLLGRATDAVIVVSERVRAQVLALRLIRPDRVTAIPNGIALHRFAARSERAGTVRAAFGIGEDQVLVVCVARLVWFKGLDTLIAAFAAVAPRCPKAHLLIVGEGPLAEDLAAQSRDLGLSQRITFAGLRNDVPDILAASDIFVLSSVSEGMPISILEAMASGLPTVATDVGGVRELVAEGETGFVVPARDAPAFAAPLERLCQDKALRKTQGAAARARAQAEFGGAAMAKRTEAVYAKALARAGRGRG